MFQMFKIYYREHGIQRIDQLLNIPNFKLKEFPRDTVFHTAHDTSLPDVDTSKEYFTGYQKKILVEQIDQYVETEGQVRKVAYNLAALTQPFRQKNRQHWMQAPEPYKTERNGLTLIVMNYGYLDTVHKYQPVALTPYHRWLNRQRTVYHQMLTIAESSDRNQFMLYPIPSVIQGKTLLDKYSKDPVSTQMVNVLTQSGEDGFFQWDLWMWLNPETRQRSLLNMIPAQHYPKINFVFRSQAGKESLVNLGFLNSWIKGQPNQTFFTSISQYDPLFIQKAFLKLCMALNAIESDESLIDSGTTATTAPKTDEEGRPPISHLVHTDTGESETTETEDRLDDDASSEDNSSDGLSELKGLSPITSKPKPVKTDAKPELVSMTAPVSSLTESMLSEVEEDIALLDRLSMVQLKNTGLAMTAEVDDVKPVIDPVIVKNKVFGKPTPEDQLKARLHSDAESNLLTAAEYRKMNQSIAAYRASEDPYGSKKPRLEAMVIAPKDLTIDRAKTTFPTSDAVPDKTMASSSLLEYDRQYIKGVLRKDVLQVIDGLQSAGVIVRNHEVDITRTILGTYENHVLELKPVDGAPSSIKFTLPVVDEDGTFLAGGNKYLMRKQRVDQILRKIGPRIVGLSTYYGKTMVQINPKVTNDPLTWIYRKINLASVTPGSYIHEVSPGDVYDNYFEAPYFFGALAKEYSEFKAGENTFIFSLEYRKKINPELLKAVEQNGRIWCGWTKDTHPIVIDQANQFFEVYKGTETALGNVYDVLRLEQAEAPVDFTEVRVFSKYIPVGVVLGYYLGFSALLSLLGITYRSVAPRKNKELQKNEFAIVFKDETCVFTTENRMGSLVMAGFLDFDKITKLYDKAEFENKAVYLNLLMSKKIASIYIRELDMLETSYVDPISREILERLQMPVTFSGLLLKATEMLQTFTHPDSQDRTVMRERGYERFAGIVYKEVMQSIRGFRNRNLAGRSKIDMSPYQVWNAIMKDSSIKIAEDTNPIQNLKEKEVMTYAGTGGRDRDTMTKSTRSYHPSDIGLLSQDTVDSSAVGTIAYLSADPNITDVRGMMAEKKELSPTSILSTSALLSPASTNDN